MPPAETTCRQRLRTLGVDFEARSAEKDEAGCSVPYPIAVKSLGKDVALEPEAVMNCAMTEAAARFVAEIVAPAAKREFGADLKSISQASAYVCRPRNGTTKLSEHAFGNALDIARFNLSDGKAVEVVPNPEEREARFLQTLRNAACGPFKTVLGPGSDADHERHFHLDLAPRKHGGTVCE
ncbi:extensin family protein [Mesorhizobium yinganensis]|uniref:extensin-like domain-containing protein n=1 Tax=Mesorhizobium yinganensis TaxID=3157707 RepID=UPI0032B7E819